MLSPDLFGQNPVPSGSNVVYALLPSYPYTHLLFYILYWLLFGILYLGYWLFSLCLCTFASLPLYHPSFPFSSVFCILCSLHSKFPSKLPLFPLFYLLFSSFFLFFPFFFPHFPLISPSFTPIFPSLFINFPLAIRNTTYAIRHTQYELIIQNEPNFKNAKINRNPYMSNNYVEIRHFLQTENEAKTNSKRTQIIITSSDSFFSSSSAYPAVKLFSHHDLRIASFRVNTWRIIIQQN